jgi:tetratricopeptide (TPR) repeat protein
MPAWQQLASLRAGAPPSRSMPSPPNVIVPSAAPPPIETLDNEGKLRRAEQLAERRSFDDALRIVDDLIARNGKDADYQALRAFILYQLFTGTQPPKPLHDAIERALRLNEAHPRALYLKGLVLKRGGNEREALRYFQRTLDADPKHLEAKRELRLAKMRRDK